MATIVVSTPRTTLLNTLLNDFVYISPTGSVVVSSGLAISNLNIADSNVTLAIDGTVVAAGVFSAISLTGSVGSNEVSIGATGIVRSMNSDGVALGGSFCELLNHGAIYANDAGVKCSRARQI